MHEYRSFQSTDTLENWLDGLCQTCVCMYAIMFVIYSSMRLMGSMFFSAGFLLTLIDKSHVMSTC